MPTPLDRLQALTEKHMNTLRLWDWSIDVGVTDLPHRADCESKPEYREAVITFDPSKIPEEDEEAFVVHELLHCHVEGLAHVAATIAGDNPQLQEWVRTEEERLTVTLEKIILGLLEGQQDDSTEVAGSDSHSEILRGEDSAKGQEAER